MANHLRNGNSSSHANGLHSGAGVTLQDIQKTNNFTSNLPPDPQYPTPAESHAAPREKLGPRMVREALYTYVRPEPTEDPELLAVSKRALHDIGLSEDQADSELLKEAVAGNKFFWDEEKGGVYPWAQCYGGFQFGSWAGQLGDGRAISLFESINPETKVRYELQLKGAGKTPYSRFADGKAVLRSSIREFVVSEYLNSLGIPTTRALSLTLCPSSRVARERIEPGAIVARFAQSWIRFGTFDLMRSRGSRDLIRKTATYVAEEVFGGWDKLPGILNSDDKESHINPARNVPKAELQGKEGEEQNRFARLYREIARRNAKTVAYWQAYGFMNGVLNTDNTSIYGLSIDYGPFAFMDNFDPAYTPNHDDHMLRYSYRAQPSIIWWNLVRLGEALGELLGAGERTDQETFVEKGVEEDFAPILIKRAEAVIDQTGDEYKAVFMSEYKRLMGARLGLKTQKEEDFDSLFSNLLDTMEALELDFNHFFRRLSTVTLADVSTEDKRKETAARFFHKEGVTGLGETEQSGKEKVGEWLEKWSQRVKEDWGDGEDANRDREKAMKSVNPNFVPRGWLLDEVIERVEKKGERDILKGIMEMVYDPFKDDWGWKQDEEQRFTGDVPRFQRALQCSCSS
jgi:serine/tyrosine/threonine adenylyltransferase